MAGTDRDVLRLVVHQAEEARAAYHEVCRMISELEARLADLNRPADAGNRAFLTTGSDMRWRGWVEQRREAINLELARLNSAKLELRARLVRSNGKAKALEAVIEQRDSSRLAQTDKKRTEALQADLLIAAFRSR